MFLFHVALPNRRIFRWNKLWNPSCDKLRWNNLSGKVEKLDKMLLGAGTLLNCFKTTRNTMSSNHRLNLVFSNFVIEDSLHQLMPLMLTLKLISLTIVIVDICLYRGPFRCWFLLMIIVCYVNQAKLSHSKSYFLVRV